MKKVLVLLFTLVAINASAQIAIKGPKQVALKDHDIVTICIPTHGMLYTYADFGQKHPRGWHLYDKNFKKLKQAKRAANVMKFMMANGWELIDKSVSHTFGNGTMNELMFMKKDKK
jgi:hypothetical protein